MDAILDILNELKPGIDYRTRHDLVDTRELDFAHHHHARRKLEDAFDITIPAVEMVPANFNSPRGHVEHGAAPARRPLFSEVPGLS